MENYSVTVNADFNTFYIGPVDNEFVTDFILDDVDLSKPLVKDGVAFIPLPGDPTDQTTAVIFFTGKAENFPSSIDIPTFTFELPVTKPLTAVGGLSFEYPVENRDKGFSMPEGNYLVKVYFKMGQENISDEEFDAGLGASTCYLNFDLL